MNFSLLDDKKNTLATLLEDIPQHVIDNYNRDFEITYTHESTAIEGNTLSLLETKAIIQDGITVGAKHLRELFEVVNHDKAFAYVKELINQQIPLDENIIKNIHAKLMDNIIMGGLYRDHAVRILGASHRPPNEYELRQEMKFFFADMPAKTNLHPVELAAWTHAEFVRIHPFADGNGRTSRMIMNYQLLYAGFLPISIKQTERLEYCSLLDQYAVTKDIIPFTAFIYAHENNALDNYISFLK